MTLHKLFQNKKEGRSIQAIICYQSWGSNFYHWVWLCQCVMYLAKSIVFKSDTLKNPGHNQHKLDKCFIKCFLLQMTLHKLFQNKRERRKKHPSYNLLSVMRIEFLSLGVVVSMRYVFWPSMKRILISPMRMNDLISNAFSWSMRQRSQQR